MTVNHRICILQHRTTMLFNDRADLLFPDFPVIVPPNEINRSKSRELFNIPVNAGKRHPAFSEISSNNDDVNRSERPHFFQQLPVNSSSVNIRYEINGQLL